MKCPAEAVLTREMGYSAVEFERVLPAAMRDWSVAGAAPEWWISDGDGRPVARVRFVPLPERRIGMLSLPVGRLTLEFGDLEPRLREEFLRRFDRGFHRGGG